MRLRRLAFTLVELLVVVGIIAVLLSLLLPTLGRVRDEAKRAACMSNLRQVGSAMLMYAADNDQTFASAGNQGYWDDLSSGVALSPSDTRAYWGVAYLPYAMQGKGYVGPQGERVLKTARSIWRCPSSRVFPDPGYSDQEKTPCAFGINIEVVARPVLRTKTSQMILAHDAPEQLLDGNGDWLTDWEHSHNPRGPDVGWFRRGQNIWQWRNPAESWYIGRAGIEEYYRHGRRCNVLWLDGHVDGVLESLGREIPRGWYTGESGI
jgi:prepilin-type processing-associated H-X9-DG protein/prepilin-type N-terminal cleavage/methylation domain-containing protein